MRLVKFKNFNLKLVECSFERINNYWFVGDLILNKINIKLKKSLIKNNFIRSLISRLKTKITIYDFRFKNLQFSSQQIRVTNPFIPH